MKGNPVLQTCDSSVDTGAWLLLRHWWRDWSRDQPGARLSGEVFQYLVNHGRQGIFCLARQKSVIANENTIMKSIS